MPKPAISFYCATYQDEKYLADTVRSLQEQTLENIEMVFIVDGSTDSSVAILEAMSKYDKRIRSKEFRLRSKYA